MTAIEVALAGLALTFALALLRVGIGPTLADRAAATDVCLYSLVAGLAVLAVSQESEAFIDVLLIATLLGFVASVALARLIGREGE
jgi:multicomponent Na+:H+ antiporter subunit F